MCIDAGARKKPGTDSPAQYQRSDDSQCRDQRGRNSHLQHLRHGRFEAYLEQEKDDAEASKQVHSKITFEMIESRKSEEGKIAEDDPEEQLSQNRRLLETDCEVPPPLGGDQHDGARQNHAGYGIPLLGVILSVAIM